MGSRMQGSYVHIGSNSECRNLGPIFSDGTFRYVPIPEKYPSDISVTYDDLGLTEFVPKKWLYAHHDPEFTTFTWGDYINKRTYTTRRLEKNDYVFFIASLQFKGNTETRPIWIDPIWAYYIIGYFVLESPIPFVEKIEYPISDDHRELFSNNAHVRRDYEKLVEEGRDGPFSIYKGTKKSRLLKVAVPISTKNKPNELARYTLSDPNESAPRWWQHKVIEDNRVKHILDEIENKQRSIS